MDDNVKAISGIVPVLFSYFDDNGALRREAFAEQIDWCLENGAAGIMVLGFGTQFYRLSFKERIAIIEDCAAHLAGRGTFGVTVMESTLEGQMELVNVAQSNGADWVILQPPLGPPPGGTRWMQMIEKVARSTTVTVAPQNATFAGSTLSIAELVELQDRCPNINHVKAETDPIDVASLIRHHGNRFQVIAGEFGIDFPFLKLAGAHGMIPTPNFVPEHVAMDKALSNGKDGLDEALALHERILPLMRLIRDRGGDETVLLAKYAFSRRSGIAVGGERLPAVGPLDPELAQFVDMLSSRITN